MSYKTIQLSKTADIIIGFPFASEKFNINAQGIRLVRGKNITTGNLRWGDDTRWWDDSSIDLSKYMLKADDIVIGMDGSLVGKNYAKISENDLPLLLVQRVACIRAKEGYDQRFLWGCIASGKFERYIDSIKTGTSIPHISGGQIGNYLIPDFDLPTQKKIAAILSALDEKIATNRAINDNLLEQMQAIYKSWFVDYLPFGGEMPESWTQTGIYSLANIIYGAPFASKQFNTEGSGKPIIRIRDLKDQQFATYTTEVHPKGYLLRPGDIVVGMDGEFRPYIWGNDEAWLNQRVCVFENKRPKGKAFLYFTIKPLLYAIEQTQVATTVIHIGKKDYDAFEIMLPDDATLDSFDSLTAPMIMQIVSNSFENKRLAAMRDALLPKLMSGEINIVTIK